MNTLLQKNRLSFLFLMLIILSLYTSAFSSNQDQFDVIYYEIDLAINPETEIIDGSVYVQAISEIDGLSQLTLDFYSNMTVTSVTGNAASFTHANNLLVIDLDRNYNQGETVSATAFYNGHPATSTGFEPMVYDHSHGTVIISSESCPYYARCWWPCKDRPDDKPQSMDIKITVPTNLTVGSNGALIEVIDNGDGTRTHHWQIRNPIATYLVSITISDYRIIQDEYITAQQDTLPIMHFVLPEDYNAALTDFDNVNQMIEILSSYYGEYPYMNEKYGVAQYVGYWGGMEYQTITSVQTYMVRGDHSYDDLFLHELAHQWWGDCVSPKDFHHSWISEGFAVFSEALYYGHLEGMEKYHSYMENQNNASGIKGIMYRHDISTPLKVYAHIVYNKGAWVLHMLRHVVGEDNFWAGLREYFSQHQYSSATTEDLQHAFEAVVGDSLGWFFHQWIYEPNYPHYYYGWQLEPITGNNIIKVFIDQIQTDAPLFKMPVDITLYSAAWESTATVIVKDSTQFFLFTPSKNITDVIIDKDNWILKETDKFTTPILEYYAHQVVDSTENNNGLAEPGETVDLLVTIMNKGTSAQDITAKLVSSDPDIQIPPETAEASFIGISYDHLDNDLALAFSFSVSSGAIGHISTFKIELTAADMCSTYTMVDSFYIKIGSPSVLLVDDDNGANYEQYFSQPMSLAKIYMDSWEVTSQGIPSYAEVLQKYQTVIWFTGDDRTTSLTQQEQQAIAAYLDQGGWLLLTGQNIGHDLIADGTPDDSTFYTDYLHAEFAVDTVNSTMIMGVPGDAIAGGMFVYIDTAAGGAGNQTAPSAINPINGATMFLKYIPQMSAAGIRYWDEATGSRIVYLPFGFEGISGPYSDTAQKLLAQIMKWFSSTVGIKQPVITTAPQKYQLQQNYPNPFNPVTRIKFHLPETDHVELSIFNLRGQKIKELVNEDFQPGIYESIWNGTDNSDNRVASGVYIYKLKTESYTCSKKLILIK